MSTPALPCQLSCKVCRVHCSRLGRKDHQEEPASRKAAAKLYTPLLSPCTGFPLPPRKDQDPQTIRGFSGFTVKAAATKRVHHCVLIPQYSLVLQDACKMQVLLGPTLQKFWNFLSVLAISLYSCMASVCLLQNTPYTDFIFSAVASENCTQIGTPNKLVYILHIIIINCI